MPQTSAEGQSSNKSLNPLCNCSPKCRKVARKYEFESIPKLHSLLYQNFLDKDSKGAIWPIGVEVLSTVFGENIPNIFMFDLSKSRPVGSPNMRWIRGGKEVAICGASNVYDKDSPEWMLQTGISNPFNNLN